MADLAFTSIMAIWGSSFAILRGLFLGSHTSPLAVLAARMALSSALLLVWMLFFRRQQLAELKATLRDGVFCGLFLGIGFVLQTEGLAHTSASRSGFLTGMLVVLTPILELLIFRKKPRAPALCGVLLAFVGMTLLSAPWSASNQATLLGDLLTAGCAVVFAGHILALGRLAPKHPVLPMLLLQLMTVAAIAAIAGPLAEPQHFDGGANLWLALVYLALFATLLAFGIQTWVQKTLPAVRIALISSLEPVFAALWAGLFLHERLGGREWIGGALIVAGVAVGEVGAALWK